MPHSVDVVVSGVRAVVMPPPPPCVCVCLCVHRRPPGLYCIGPGHPDDSTSGISQVSPLMRSSVWAGVIPGHPFLPGQLAHRSCTTVCSGPKQSNLLSSRLVDTRNYASVWTDRQTHLLVHAQPLSPLHPFPRRMSVTGLRRRRLLLWWSSHWSAMLSRWCEGTG